MICPYTFNQMKFLGQVYLVNDFWHSRPVVNLIVNCLVTANVFTVMRAATRVLYYLISYLIPLISSPILTSPLFTPGEGVINYFAFSSMPIASL